MQFIHLLTLCLSTLSIAYTSVSQVLTDITDLDNAVQALTTSTASYTGGILLTQGIDFSIVEARLTEADTDVTSLPPTQLSDADTQSLIDLVRRTLAIDNPRAVKTLEAKKSLIEATPGQGLVVRAGLQALLAGHLEFSDQALQRTPDELVAQVQQLVDVISDALQDGINAFST